MPVILEIKISLVSIKRFSYQCHPPYTMRVSSHRVLYLYSLVHIIYRISSNKCQASNKGLTLISDASLGIHIEISTAPLSAAFIRTVTKFY